MIPDPDAAAAYMKPGTIITFTGGREFDHPRGRPASTRGAIAGSRRRWIVRCQPRADETVVYSIGTLYGEWIDGTPFEGNRLCRPFCREGWSDREDGCLERQRGTHSGSAGDLRRRSKYRKNSSCPA